MLNEIAEGVLVHESRFVQTNTVVVEAPGGALLVDPGIHAHELECLVGDLAERGLTVNAAFSTHPHWDHMLWHPDFGPAPRHATALAEVIARERLAGGVDRARVGIPDDVPLELLGQITGLAAGAIRIPWDGPAVRIIEHRAHAPGHAALLIEERGVLVAGDMLSDGLVPMLDGSAADPFGDYLDALQLLERAAGEAGVLVPGHGSVARGDELQERVELDRAYVEALRDGSTISDPRIGPSAEAGWEWVTGVHDRQVQQFGN